ncbi:uncharacterized protein LOC105217303 [Zeugodacus cucurbitae]|uniref:uncharacterized protein LOC105217303 n=1 Tax=Zeugodacus cucurbitae TaxID=28588 RepID=UPI0023D93C99|nr:uncharacterized protein LOC105217303 [Zeugodacus cucurbitae]
MFSHTQRWLLLLFAITIATATTTSAAIVPHSTAKISPEIINELKDFLDLIPTATVDEIVAKHYITDSNFREVLKYLRSTQFTALMQQVQQIPEVIDILDYLHLLVPDAQQQFGYGQPSDAWTSVGGSSEGQLSSEPQLNFVLLNDSEENEVLPTRVLKVEKKAETVSPPLRLRSPPASRHLRTFSSFVEELLGHLPHDRYVQLINQKRQQNLTFAQFYAALRSAELRPMVDATLKSSNLTSIIKTLAANGVDVTSLEAIAFKVISWGPVPIALP